MKMYHCVVELDRLDEPQDENPNRMDADQYEALKQAIHTRNFLQPILIREKDLGRFEIIDGIHRTRAARELELANVPAVVAAADDQQAKMLRIGMNRLRGQLDLVTVGRQFEELLNLGTPLEELATCGFNQVEIDTMVKALNRTMAEAIEDSGAQLPPASGTPAPAPELESDTFVLEVHFDDKASLQKARRLLKKRAKLESLSQWQMLLQLLDTVC